MTAADALRDYYRKRAEDPDLDAAERAAAQEQLDRLGRMAGDGSSRGNTEGERVSRWRHVPLADLFRQAGNEIHERTGGKLQTGHEPAHPSRSGTCVVIWPDSGRWWCSSCRQGGDAVTLIRALYGCTYQEAVWRLAQEYGPPAGVQRRPSRPVLEA